MYLAKTRILNQPHYYIRHSYRTDDCYHSRDLYDLGTDPRRFIIYPGGRSYYYDPEIIDALTAEGLEVDQTALDPIFYDFLRPDIQRIIQGFDRSYQGRVVKAKASVDPSADPVHLFDKRRFYFLRFGARLRQHIHRQPEKIFAGLQRKSRDEIEQYFLKIEEQLLKVHEIPLYVTTIFDLKRILPDPTGNPSAQSQLDRHFMTNFCQLDNDEHFWAGMPKENHLHEYFIKYAIMYFDFNAPPLNPWHHTMEDFINRHRTYSPPLKVRVHMKEAETLFGLSWKELKRMNRTTLVRKYRRLALKHHPDQGGDPEQFKRLSTYYKMLLSKKPRQK